MHILPARRGARPRHVMGLSAAGLLVVGTVMLLSLMVTPTDAGAFNVTALLGAFPSYSQFTSSLASTGVADEINARSSLTILVVTDPVFSAFVAANPNVGTAQLGDLLRYQTLLQYLDIPELNTITVGNPSTVTTLYQTTGRAPGNSGSVNIYNNGTDLLVGQADVNTPPTTLIVTNLTQVPYNISFLEVDTVVVPTGFGAPTATANLTAVLEAGKNYGTLLGLLQSTGTDVELASLEKGAGVTIFAPNDAAFSALPAGALAGLSPAQTKLLIEYHVLTSYHTLGSLEATDDSAAPTVATTNTAPGQYTVSISGQSSSVILNSGLSNTTIAGTLYDSPPTAVYGVGTILLPKEIFAVAPAPSPALVPASAPSPLSGPVPAPTPLAPTLALAPLSPTPTPTPVPVPAPSSPTPAPAPSPLSPSPTPTATPAPVPSPLALSPGPPAPLVPSPGSISGEEPASAPGASATPPSDGTSTTINLALLTAVAFFSSVVLL